MEAIFLIFLFLLGLIIGSFLNVLILRFNTGKSFGGRSGCLYCGKTLSFFELVPIISYLFQKGRCLKCFSKISIQYPLVELSTAIFFVLVYLELSDLIFISPTFFSFELIFTLIVFSILIIIFVYDLYHKIIPNTLVYIFSIISLIHFLLLPLFEQISFNEIFKYPNILDLLAGPILFLPFYFLWIISKGKWIGLGDGKLSLGIGWFLGFINGISAIILAFWIGALFSMILLLILRLKEGGGSITMKSEIPFAPFLIIGTVISFFFSLDVLNLGILLYL